MLSILCAKNFTALPQILPFTFGEESVNAGDSSTVSCSVIKGDSPISISWLFNETEINHGQGINVFQVGNKASSLSIDTVQAHHSGGYICVARNIAGATNFSAYLHVNGTNEIFTISVACD
jgi:hypothetical protein